MQQKKFSVTGMTCAACSSHVEKAVRGVDGVKDVNVSLLTNSMTVTCDSPATDEKICAAVSSAGYGASVFAPKSEKNKSPIDDGAEAKKVLFRLIASVCLLVPLMYISMGHVMWGWWIPEFMENHLVLAITELIIAAAVMIINQKFFVSGTKGLLHGAPNMDTLVSMGSAAAFVYSVALLYKMCVTTDPEQLHTLLHGMYFESAAMILTLITVGKMLEAHSKGKTTSAIRSLMELSPKTATVIRDGKETVISADDMVKGDIFIVRPGESIPCDGVVLEGESAVNEAALTGESLPVDKSAGSKVSAATINQNGFLRCEATRVGGDTTLSQIIEMVENAAASKAPIAKIADRVSGIFVPTVIGIAAVTFVVWMIAGRGISFSLARAISVLVISCPCALGLATPVAIMAGSGKGAKNGILFKTASSLEAAGKVSYIAFDKTGTITEGRPQVTDIIPAEGISENDLLLVAASIEGKSEHPLAKAISERAEHDGLKYSAVSEFAALPGHGVKGSIGGKVLLGGNETLMRDNGIDGSSLFRIGEKLASDGKTPLYFAMDEKLLGVIGVADTVKADSAKAISELKNMGIVTVMLTGDNARTARAVAKKVGVDAVISDVLPDGKEAVIRKLSEYGSVAMVGDGINDAPALTRADVGIAVGAGTDVAIDSADVVLMKNELCDVSAAIRLSRRTLTNIKENLFWAFFYNCIGIPIAAGVLIPIGFALSPMIGAAAMSLSSFCVVTNALRLNLVNVYDSKRDREHKKAIIPDFISDKSGDNNIPNKNEKKEKNDMKIIKTLTVEGMMCGHCKARVEQVLSAVDGVEKAEVDLDKKMATVTLSRDIDCAELKKAVTDAGYKVTDCK